jgi:hypothetical protein
MTDQRISAKLMDAMNAKLSNPEDFQGYFKAMGQLIAMFECVNKSIPVALDSDQLQMLQAEKSKNFPSAQKFKSDFYHDKNRELIAAELDVAIRTTGESRVELEEIQTLQESNPVEAFKRLKALERDNAKHGKKWGVGWRVDKRNPHAAKVSVDTEHKINNDGVNYIELHTQLTNEIKAFLPALEILADLEEESQTA